MRNFLHTRRVVLNLPLSYVIRKDTNPLNMDHSELIIYNANLTTVILKADISKVENVLTTLVLETYAFEWGGRRLTHNNRREIWLYLVSHYDIVQDSHKEQEF